MNNQKIINLANPTDHQDTVTKISMLIKKQKQYINSLFCQNMLPEVSSLKHSLQKKQCAGTTQTATQTVKYFVEITLVLLLSINQEWTTMQYKKNSLRQKIST